MVKEEDCNVALPSPIDDQYMLHDSNWSAPTPAQSTSALPSLVNVIGGIAKLIDLLKSQQIAPPVLEAYDAHFVKCMVDFPSQHRLQKDGYIDPIELPPMIYLQNARIILHRHNMTPICEPSLRSAAIDSCLSVAKDTASFLRRCMQELPAASPAQITTQDDTWEKRMVSAASAFFCTHIWRCTLFLCFRLEFEIALICARASAILGDTRPINTACGRYLEFFLQHLSSKMQSNVQLDDDEEMIAYLSADHQGSFGVSWIWQESKGDVHLGRPMQGLRVEAEDNVISQSNGTPTFKNADLDWKGWGNILKSLNQLLQSKQRKESQSLARVVPQQEHGEVAPLAESPVGINNPNRINIRDLI